MPTKKAAEKAPAPSTPQPVRCRCGSQVFAAPPCYVLIAEGEGLRVEATKAPADILPFTCIECGLSGTLAYLKEQLYG